MPEELAQSAPLDRRSHLYRIANQFAIYGLGGVVEKLVISLLLLPVYTNYLSTAEYGVLARALLICGILGLVISGGMHNALLKFYADAPDTRQKVSVYATILLFVWIATPLAGLILLPHAGTVASWFLGDRSYAGLVVLLLVYLPLGVTNDIAATCFRAMQKPMSFVVLSMGRSVLAFSLNIFFIVSWHYGVSGVLWSAIITNGLGAVAVQLILLKGVGFHPNYRKLAPILAYGLPLVPFTIFELLMLDANKFIIGWFCPAADVGIFALAQKLAMAIFFLFIMPFERVWTAYLFDLQKKPEGAQVWSRVLTYLMLLLTATSLGVALFIREIVHVLCNQAYWSAASLVPIILLGQLFYATTRVFNGGLLVKSEGGMLSLFTTIGFVVNILANLAFVYWFGAVGAAVAALVTNVVMAGMSYWTNQRVLPIPYEWKRTVGPVLLASGLFALGLLQGPSPLWKGLAVHGALWLAFPAGLLLLGFFTPGEKAAAWEWIGRARALAMRPWRRPHA